MENRTDIRVLRHSFEDTYTIGKMFVDGEYLCDTLEDRVRNLPHEPKIKGATAIPAGKYKVKLTHSRRFDRVLPILLDVPYFEGIRIHRGNTDKDTEGCILVGDNKVKGKVINSAICERRLMGVLQNCKGDITISVEDGNN